MKSSKRLIFGMLLLISAISQAQVNVNVNIGNPPAWGPVGYTDVRYYYIPDIETYYDIQTSDYIYISKGKWIHGRTLPVAYRNYDLYGGYKVVLTDYRGNTPYANFKAHKIKYAKGYKGKPQKTIGAKPGKGNNKAQGKAKGHGEGKGHGKKGK
ncbi:hypothetical protein MH928_11230 [Flavobacterium sp. WW92]|uniref:hypothetical protein n=1 Tax=unclassified Flavobacterium TaxID=196869 RepID=UPI002225B01C|nr:MULTISPECIES: hypothetical protein [unclassified Flavobacterium]WDO11901.1 hypothetical protein MH928_11230 [Flavobacterium sp. WW92]